MQLVIEFPNKEKFTASLVEIGQMRLDDLREKKAPSSRFHMRSDAIVDWACKTPWSTISKKLNPAPNPKPYYRSMWSGNKCHVTYR